MAADTGGEVNSPAKSKVVQNKRKGGPQGPKQVYRRVELPLQTDVAHTEATVSGTKEGEIGAYTSSEQEDDEVREPKKKKPTPILVEKYLIVPIRKGL